MGRRKGTPDILHNRSVGIRFTALLETPRLGNGPGMAPRVATSARTLARATYPEAGAPDNGEG